MSQHTPTTTDSTSLEDLSSLLSEQTAQSSRRIPLLEKWSPTHCGDMDLVIKANGEWWHEGRKMTRQSMIDLFASVLWCEKTHDKSTSSDKVAYFLKTPIEKIAIQVEDVPLFINQVEQITSADGVASLVFSTTTGDVLTADRSHPLLIRTALDNPSEQRLYLKVRQNGDSILYGLIQRNVWFHLIAMGELRENVADTTVVLTLSSEGQDFELAMPNI